MGSFGLLNLLGFLLKDSGGGFPDFFLERYVRVLAYACLSNQPFNLCFPFLAI
jgi:hypothetical protein